MGAEIELRAVAKRQCILVIRASMRALSLARNFMVGWYQYYINLGLTVVLIEARNAS